MIYFDSAATTSLHPDVKEEMIRVMDFYGNPSSTHEIGRKSKIEIERVRKMIAQKMKCQTGEIFFCAGGTEADNFAILSSVRDLGVKHIITSAIEHHAVGHTIDFLEAKKQIRVSILPVDERGDINLDDLEKALQTEDKTLVSLMFANNEIGNLNPMKDVVALAKKHNALVHSDCVQAVGHVPFDLQEIPFDFIAFSAHKIHGPKGTGFCFVRGGLHVKPQILGGGQERNMRAGTENLMGIVGMGKAFDLALTNFESDSAAITELKKYTIAQLQDAFDDIVFLGQSGDIEKSLFTVLNVGFPQDGATGMLTFSLDMKGIAASGGSACNSGSNQGSHVIAALGEKYANVVPLRISFSKFNTKAEVDALIQALREIRA
jgi:cysteine desulfurase